MADPLKSFGDRIVKLEEELSATQQRLEVAETTNAELTLKLESWGAKEKAKVLKEVKLKLTSVADGYNYKTSYGEGRIDSVNLCIEEIDELLLAEAKSNVVQEDTSRLDCIEELRTANKEEMK